MIGRERALYLVGQLPRCIAGEEGKQSSRVIMYVPTVPRLTLQHALVRILGYPDALKLCKAFGGEILQPANCSEIYRNYRYVVIDSYLRAGVSADHIAAILGMNAQYIRQVSRDKQIPQEECRVAANDNAPIKRKARAANERSRNGR